MTPSLAAMAHARVAGSRPVRTMTVFVERWQQALNLMSSFPDPTYATRVCKRSSIGDMVGSF